MSTSPNSLSTSAADKQKLLVLLRQSRERFLGSFAGVGDQQCRCRPAENQWSILDTVEHIAVAEKMMLHLVTSTRRTRAPEAPNREEVFLRVLPDRSRKMKSPEGGRPQGRFASMEEALEQFQAAREGVIQFVQQSREDLRATEVTHPHPAAGTVSTYEMIIILAKHAERHALQIEEIRNVLSLH